MLFLLAVALEIDTPQSRGLLGGDPNYSVYTVDPNYSVCAIDPDHKSLQDMLCIPPA